MARLDAEMVLAARKPLGWAPTIALHGAWRGAGAARGLPAGLTIAGPDLRPTPQFLGVWRAAFPGTSAPRVNEPLITRGGMAAKALLDAFRQLP